jgi:hypothetical protein
MDEELISQLIPYKTVDRFVGSYFGGTNTDQYYKEVYSMQDGMIINGVPTERLVVTLPSGETIVLDSSGNPVSQPTTETLQIGTTEPATVDLSLPSIASGILEGIFSVAVIVTLISAIAIVYIIIRTRQLHHHVEHIHAVGAHGHGHDKDHVENDHTEHVLDHTDHTPTSQDTDHMDHPSYAALGHDTVPVDQSHDSSAHTEPDIHTTIVQPYMSSTSIPLTDQILVEGKDMMTRIIERWAHVVSLSHSEDKNDLTFALMDIDLILEDLLRMRGLPGNDVGEMLLSATEADIPHITTARQAHALHTDIVDGEELLSRHTIERLIDLYGSVFSELQHTQK